MDEEANQCLSESENAAASPHPVRSPYILEFVNVTDIPCIDNKVKSDPYLQAFIAFPMGEGDKIRYQKAGSTVRTPVRFDCTSVVWNCFRDMNVNPVQGSILSIELYHHHRDSHKSDHLLGTVDIPLSGLADEEPVAFPMINFKSGLEGKNPDFAVTVRRCFIDRPPPLYRTFYLIRHGQSKWNRAMARINITGLLDRDHALTSEGIQEALALNAKWRDVLLEDHTYNTMHSEENSAMVLPIFDFSRLDQNEELALLDEEHSDSDDSDLDEVGTPVPGTSAPKSGGIGLGKLYDSFFLKKGTPSVLGTGPPSIRRDSGVCSPALGSPITPLPLVSPKNSCDTVPPLATRRQSEVMSESSVGIASHTSSFFSAEDAIATGLGPCIGEGLGLASMSGTSAESSVSGRPGSANSNAMGIPVAARKFIYNSDSPSPSGSPSLEKCAAIRGFDSFAEGEVRSDPFAGLGSSKSSAFSPSVPQDEAQPTTSSNSFVDTATLDKIFPPAEQLSLKNPANCKNSSLIAPTPPPQMTRSRANSNVTPRGSITVNPIEAALDKPVIVTPFGALSGLSVALAAADNANNKRRNSQPPAKQEIPLAKGASFRPTECINPLTPLPVERETEYFSPPSSMDASFHPTLPAKAEDDLVITPTVTQPVPMPSVAEENGTSGVAHSAYQELKSLEFPISPHRAESDQLDSSQSGSIPTTLFQPSSPGFQPTLPDHHDHSHSLMDVLQDLGLARPPSKSLEDVFEDFPSVPIGDLNDVAFPLEIVVQADDPEEHTSARTLSLSMDEVRLLQINAALSPEQIAEIESVTSTEVDLPPPPDDADLPQRREEYIRMFLRADIVYSSPLTRAVQTALAAMCGHPALTNNKLTLYRPIREIKRIGGLDTVGIECGAGIMKRVLAELTSAVGAAKANELMDGVDVDTSGADVPWWTPISSFDNDKDQLERIREFISYSRYCPHPVPVFVGHSLFFRAFYSKRISTVMSHKRPNLSANMKRYKLSNATLLAVTVKYHDLECGSSDAMILDADVLFGGGFHGARLVHQPPPEGSERGGDRGLADAATIEALDIDGSLLLQEDGAGMQKIASSIQQASSSSSSAISKSVNIISSTISDLF